MTRNAKDGQLALVIAAHGRQFYLESSDGSPLIAVTRGKRADISVGDRVIAQSTAPGQAVIESLQPRVNELRRSDQWRSKRLAANVDQLGVVLAGAPPYSEALLLRILVAAQAERIPAALIVNKADLADALALIGPRLDVYRALGYPVMTIAAGADPEGSRQALLPWLANRTTLLLGQSGMGKSTLVNLLVPDAGMATRTISDALQTGKHTTTFTRMFQVADGRTAEGITRIVDSPGFQTFGLAHLSRSEVMHGMPEFAPYLGTCRFHNCTHRDEPGCAIRAAAQAGRIDPRRYELYQRLIDEVLAMDAPGNR